MKRRIAMISDHASPLAALGGTDSGGQNVYVAQVARNLAAAGCEVDVFTRRDNSQQPEIVNWFDNVRVIHVPAGPAEFVRKEDLLKLMPQFTSYMLRFFRQKRYDLIHANFFLSGLVALNLKRATETPFVVTFHALGRVRRIHQTSADEFPDARFEIEDQIVREADFVIAECPQDETDLMGLYDSPPEKIRIVPCGFDGTEVLPIEKAAAREFLNFKKDEKIVLQIGRMVRRKGVETVVRAVADLIRKHGVNAKLVIVGGESRTPDAKLTPEIGRLQKIAAELGIAENVVFAGCRRRDELKYYYSAADVFVSVPWYEPFGITPLEAMACGAPVVGSNVGGIKFTVADGETGFLVEPKNHEQLAEKLAVLCGDAELREQFGANAVARVNKHFTWRKVAKQIAQVYEETVAKTKPKSFADYAPLAIKKPDAEIKSASAHAA